ncbi:MAG TPA: hypothetical protein PJ982_13435 [Lacipirellulaceae bacterium]|nr:hypothetical protein [Lacipirellulaceae bacterium]
MFAALLVAIATPARGVDYTFGSFEGTTLGFGWSDWSGTATFSNSTVGATAGTQSIKTVPVSTSIGYYQGLTVKLQDLPDNVAAFDAFINNTHIAYDITYDPADFVFTNEGWNGGRFLLYYNEQGAGWADNIGVDIGDANGFKVPHLDTGNPTNPGFWDLGNYPTVHTRTIMWDYTEFLPALTSTEFGGWTEFILAHNFGNFSSMAYLVDNVRFTTPPQGTPGDFNGDDVVDGADFIIWQRGGSPNPNSPDDLNAWRDNFAPAALSAAGAIPEPGSAALAACAGVLLLGRRRR